MQLANCQPLFAWDALEDSPSLGTIKRLLAAIPDAPLLDSLRQARGHGRDDHRLERFAIHAGSEFGGRNGRCERQQINRGGS